MKIISYNVNGIRAAMRKGFIDWLKAANPDVICLQETKANFDQVEIEEIEKAGYPFHYWYSAVKKRVQRRGHFFKSKTQSRGIRHRH